MFILVTSFIPVLGFFVVFFSLLLRERGGEWEAV